MTSYFPISHYRILDAIWSTNNKQVHASELMRAAGLTLRGWNMVRDKMMRENLIARIIEGQNLYTITLTGMKAMEQETSGEHIAREKIKITTSFIERQMRTDPEVRAAIGRLGKAYSAYRGPRNREAFFFALRMEIMRSEREGA